MSFFSYIVVCKTRLHCINKLNPLHFFKCIADDTRLKTILLIAHEDELCVCELVAALDVSQPKISRHLAVLRQCGLLADRKQNQWVFYSLNKPLPDWAKDVITKTLHATPTFYEYQLQRLNVMGKRP